MQAEIDRLSKNCLSSFFIYDGQVRVKPLLNAVATEKLQNKWEISCMRWYLYVDFYTSVVGHYISIV